MIAYSPAIYPDELVYSWLCRYYVHSGFFSSKSAMQELYCKRSDNPSKEFIGNLNPGAIDQVVSLRQAGTGTYDVSSVCSLHPIRAKKDCPVSAGT